MSRWVSRRTHRSDWCSSRNPTAIDRFWNLPVRRSGSRTIRTGLVAAQPSTTIISTGLRSATRDFSRHVVSRRLGCAGGWSTRRSHGLDGRDSRPVRYHRVRPAGVCEPAFVADPPPQGAWRSEFDLRQQQYSCRPGHSGIVSAWLGSARTRLDKSWSLTDCISFEVMRSAQATDALTYDQHFEQAGFRALLRGNPPE